MLRSGPTRAGEALVHREWSPYRKGKCGYTNTHGECHVKSGS